MLYFCTFILLSSLFCAHGHIHEYYTDLYAVEKVSTEYFAYQLLKQEPIPGVNYLAIPWVVLINTNKLSTVPDIKLAGGFTICQHIHFKKIIPILKKIGINVLFTPHVEKSQKYDDEITILPFPHYAVNGTIPFEHKDLLYSFVGTPKTDAVRAELFKIIPPQNAILMERFSWHFYNPEEQQKKEKEEYQNLLARSRFSPCPRGTGASTIRFWESLQAGAIPLLLADEMSLPKGIDWNNCIIQIPEKEVSKLNEIIQHVSLEEEQEKRANCLKAYELFSGKNFVRCIRLFYKNVNT